MHRVKNESFSRGRKFSSILVKIFIIWSAWDLKWFIRPFVKHDTCWFQLETLSEAQAVNCSWTSGSSRFCLLSPRSWTTLSRCSSLCRAEDFVPDQCTRRPQAGCVYSRSCCAVYLFFVDPILALVSSGSERLVLVAGSRIRWHQSKMRILYVKFRWIKE